MTRFEGFGPKVEKWFKGLEADNSREYFSGSREFFEVSIRDQMEALLTELSEKFGGEVKMFRQNRDIRFSPDKSPQDQHVRRPARIRPRRPGVVWERVSSSGARAWRPRRAAIRRTTVVSSCSAARACRSGRRPGSGGARTMTRYAGSSANVTLTVATTSCSPASI